MWFHLHDFSNHAAININTEKKSKNPQILQWLQIYALVSQFQPYSESGLNFK